MSQKTIALWQAFVAPFYARNDTAHMINHANYVCINALELNSKLPDEVKYNDELVIAAAYLHDIYAVYRDEHHLLAADFVHCMSTQLPTRFSDTDLYLIAGAVREHRASWTGGWSSLLSEVIATADRGKPGDIKHYILRSYDYSVSKLLNTPTESLEHAAHHVKDKWGSAGYAVYPPLYVQVYKEALAEQQHWLDAHSTDCLVEMIPVWLEERQVRNKAYVQQRTQLDTGVTA